MAKNPKRRQNLRSVQGPRCAPRARAIADAPLRFWGKRGRRGREKEREERGGRGGVWIVKEGGDAQFSTSDSTLEGRVTTGFSVPDLDRRPCPSSLPI